MASDVRVESVSGNPTPEELVTVTVAVTALAEQAATVVAPADDVGYGDGWLSMWVEASRRAAQRSSLQRGPWRISGRIARRSRI
jgi:hypothetical protein